jgi:hypothetical protein
MTTIILVPSPLPTRNPLKVSVLDPWCSLVVILFVVFALMFVRGLVVCGVFVFGKGVVVVVAMVSTGNKSKASLDG